ncbi:MAG: hypothetical protein V4466_08160 [Pseudomonadota bacterium]
MKRVLIAACASLALTACATAPTVYQPADRTAVGFTDYRIESGRYRVTFNGGRGAPLSQVADFALLRAAEVSVADGYDWFRIVDRQDGMNGAPSSGPRVSLGGGGSNWDGGYSRGGYRGSGSSVGLGAGVSFDLSGGPAYSRTIEVLAGKGRKPADADVYDARDVIRVVGQGLPTRSSVGQ